MKDGICASLKSAGEPALRAAVQSLIISECQVTSATVPLELLPQLFAEHSLQQRKGSRLRRRVRYEPIPQRGLQVHAHSTRRRLDRLGEKGPPQRRKGNLVDRATHQWPQVRLQKRAKEVGAQRRNKYASCVVSKRSIRLAERHL